MKNSIIYKLSLAIGLCFSSFGTISAQDIVMPFGCESFKIGVNADVVDVVPMAINLYFGYGLKQDTEKALILLHKAVEVAYPKSFQKDLSACLILAKIAKIDKLFDKEAEYYYYAASAGSIDAINEYAYCYARGEGVDKDFAIAHQTIDNLTENESLSAQIRANAFDSKGEFYLMEGNRDKAKEMLDKALTLYPDIAKEKSKLFLEFYPSGVIE